MDTRRAFCRARRASGGTSPVARGRAPRAWRHDGADHPPGCAHQGAVRDRHQSRSPMTAILRAVVHRDLLLAWRRRSDVATAVLFFVIVVSLFPLGIGPEP